MLRKACMAQPWLFPAPKGRGTRGTVTGGGALLTPGEHGRGTSVVPPMPRTDAAKASGIAPQHVLYMPVVPLT